MEKLHSNPTWQQLQSAYLATGESAPVQCGLSQLVDAMTLEAYQSTLANIPGNGLAMIAVGGYGRRELFPYSDVDVMILTEHEAQTAGIKNELSEFVRLLWDSDLRLSHSVRTVAECSALHEQNIELSISLLDRRFLTGSRDVFAQLEAKFPAFLERQARALTRHLCNLTHARHSKYQDTLYHLEPDIKETPGGLRDVHLVAWLALLRNSGAALESLREPARFLSSLRCFLHYQAQRDQNLLSFEAQHELAGRSFLPVQEPSAFMREYFRNVRAIFTESQRALDWAERSATSLVVQFRDWRSRLSNADFTVSNERVLLRSPTQLESNPEIFFRLFEFVARHGVRPAADTERRLEAHRDVFARYSTSGKPLWPALRNVLALPRAAMALRVMQNTGLMLALFPEWNTITCLVIPDYYHRYTVDEHTLVAIEKLGELAAAEEPVKRRLAEILAEIDDPALLRFALLFHDSGKGSNEGDHSKRSMELAETAMARVKMPPDQRNTVQFLIEHHLDLSAVMNSRDINDPTTARMLAGRIGTLERLKMLVILTYCDISAVNPGAMSPWRLEQLWQTYRVTHQELVRELETDRINDVPQDSLGQANFIKGFPVRYLRTHTPDEIRAHVDLYELSRPTGVAVALDRWGGVYRATIIARDTPGLFASLAGAISSFGMDIVKAEAFANAKRQILDTFAFADPKRTLELNPPELERLQFTLEQVALGKLDVVKLLDGRRQYPKQKIAGIRPSVQFDSDACETATLVEIIAEDRPRLLYDLSSTFSSLGCNIDVVLVDTEGHKAIDVFYVASDGSKLTPLMQNTLEQRLLAVC